MRRERRKEKNAAFTRGNFHGTRKKKKKDLRKLGEPRSPCECQQPFALHTLLLGIYDRSPVSGRSPERRDRRRLRHVENSATSAEWLDGDTATGRFFSGVTRARTDKFSRHSAGNSHDHSKFLTCRTRVSNTPPRWHLALHFSLRQALGNEPKIG